MRSRILKFKLLALFAASIALGIAFACGSDTPVAPTAVPAAEIAAMVRDAVSEGQTSGADIQKMVENAVMSAGSGVTAAELTAALEDATKGQLSAAEVQSIVDRSVRALPAPEIDVSQIEGLIESAVRANVPEGTSGAEIQRMVSAAVSAATANAATRGDLQTLVAKSIQDAAAGQLTASDVQKIVDASLTVTNKAIEEAAMATEELQKGQLTATDVQQIVDTSLAGPAVCMSKGYEITDCPPRSPHQWTPSRQQVPGEVWVFQDYDGPKPTQFYESPYSAQLVKQGLIPALTDRLPVPEDVEVLAGPDGIGEYGGYYRMCCGNYIGEWVTASWNRRDSLGGLKWFPWVGKGWEVSEDGRVWTFTNRRGLKWSDGQPLDMESVEFAWELNFDPTFDGPFPLWASSPVTQNPPTFTVVDDVTWTLTYDDPIFTIMESRSTPSALCGPKRVCIISHPKMQKYYPQYAGQAAIDKLIKDEGHTDLVALLNNRWHLYTNIDEIPCASPFCAISYTPSLTEWEKNQFHWFVDPEGNQIPYLDGAVMWSAEGGRDVQIFRAMAGEEDGRTSYFIPGEIPLYIQNMERGDFSVYHWPSSGGADLSTTMQQTYNVDPRIGELIRTRDFRIALSHTVDKEDLNSVVLSGVGVVQNRVPRPNNPYYPGDEYRMLHIEQDVAKANQMLDGIGLTGRDADNFRMHKDGSGTVEMTLTIGDNPAVVQAAEILKAAWEGVGIKTMIDARAQAYKITRGSQGTSSIARDYSAYQYNPWMVQWTSLAPLSRGEMAGEIGQWYSTKGQEGMAPTGGDPEWLPLAGAGEFPADAGGLLQRSAELWIGGLSTSNLDPKRIAAGKEMFATNADQLWALNCCAYSGVFRGVYINRNNFRNKPITHERDHNGFSAWARFFEHGMDNYHHPNNRSQYCQSWAFVQGGSPYDRCTKRVW